MERRLAEIPPEEWNNLAVDLTPKDQVLDYLMGAFPVMAMDAVEDEDGNVTMVPVMVDGRRPVVSQEALRLREELVTHLACLPAVPGVLDAVLEALGTEQVAEITGRSRRVVTRDGRRVVERRSASAAKAETDAFMAGKKRVLVFSRRRRHRAQLPRRPRRPEPAAPGPLPGRAGLAGRRGHPGPGPLAPDQPGPRAAVPAGDHRHPRREAVHLDHRPAARQPGRPDPGRAAHGRQRPLPRRGQSGKPLGAPRAAGLLRRPALRQRRGDGPGDLRGQDRPAAARPRGQSARSPTTCRR